MPKDKKVLIGVILAVLAASVFVIFNPFRFTAEITPDTQGYSPTNVPRAVPTYVEAPEEKYTFSSLVRQVKAGEVISLHVIENRVTVETADGKWSSTSFGSGDLIERLISLGVSEEQLANLEITYSIPPPFWLLPFILVAGSFIVFAVMVRRSSGTSGPLSFGKSHAKEVSDGQLITTFEDVAGLIEAKEELMEVVEFLKNPERFTALGARIPKGVILFGLPGCGKTLLARAVAGEAEVPFFPISGSEFVEMFVGVGASRIRDLFTKAKEAAPCILFIDELDAVGGRRSGFGMPSAREHDQTLNQLLSEMDGFDQQTNVIVIGATNRLDVLDPALLRSGRFDRRIAVDRPDVRAREAIFEVHVKGKPLSDDVDLSKLARATPGLTGADIENIVNEAAILTARHGRKVIGNTEFEDAALKVVAGPERKSRVISEEEKRKIAYHEVGHALAMHFTKGSDPVHKISIISRGLALGFTMPLPEEDRNLPSYEWLVGQIVGLLGGRAAEEIVLGKKGITTGASNDLERATDYARRMVTEWGMSEKVGLRSLNPLPDAAVMENQFRDTRSYSDHLAETIDAEVKRILDEAYDQAKEILASRRDILKKVVERLLEVETLDRKEFLTLVS